MLKTKYTEQAVTVGDAELQVDLQGHFTDAEQSELKYTAVSSSSKVCSVRVDGTDLFIKGLTKGTSTIMITADDQLGKKASTSFKVRVNEAPVSSGIPDQSKQAGSGDVALSLGTYFTDSENDPLTYEVSADDPSIATFTLTGDQLVLTPAAAGQTQVTVKASDGRGGSNNQSFKMEVTAVPGQNQNPAVSQEPSDQTVTVGASDYTLDLSSVFSDPDGDPVIVTADSSDSSVASVSVNGSQAAVHAVSSGTATIQLKAEDGQGGEVTTGFVVTVNESPTSEGIPDQTKEIDTGDIELYLNHFFSDPENNVLTYSVEDNSDPNVVRAVMDGNVLTLTPLNTGSSSVTVKAADGRGGEVTETFQISVTPEIPTNQDPEENKPADKSLTVGEASYSLDLGSVFTDPDGDSLTYDAVSTDSSVASAEVDGTTLKIQALTAGTTTIEMNASDGRGGTASTSFEVTVQSAGSTDPSPEPTPEPSPEPSTEPTTEPSEPTNPSSGGSSSSSSNQVPQVVASIYEQVLTAGVTNARSYDLSQLFSDDDGDALTFTAVPASGGMVNADISGSMLTLTPGNQAGSTKVTITADDGNGGTAAYDLQVTNAPLAANGLVPVRTKQGVNDPITYDLSTLFPGQTSFKVYSGTPDSTFTGPTTLNGTVWTWNGDPSQLYWVVAADGTSAVFEVSVSAQGSEDLYFSQYLSLDKTRTAIQLFYNPVGDLSNPIENAGYTLEIHQYNSSTHASKVWSQPLFSFWKGMPYIFIDSIFYDFFDIVPVSYYNDEMMLLETNTNFTTGYVLKKNGVTIDVLGDPNGTTQFMPNNGTIIRKSGIKSGSATYNLPGEWNSYPVGTLQYFNFHTT